MSDVKLLSFRPGRQLGCLMLLLLLVRIVLVQKLLYSKVLHCSLVVFEMKFYLAPGLKVGSKSRSLLLSGDVDVRLNLEQL